jgi:hypothetical protein
MKNPYQYSANVSEVVHGKIRQTQICRFRLKQRRGEGQDLRNPAQRHVEHAQSMEQEKQTTKT